MKEKFKSAFKNPMLIVFIVILIFFVPTALFAPGENRVRGVVTAIGIDKFDDEYEVSFLVFIPTADQNFQDKNSVITGKGKSVGEAVFKSQVAMGRKIGLYHAKTTVVHESLLEEDVEDALDYLSRVASLPEDTILVCSDKPAKSVLKATQSLRKDLGFKIEQLISFNSNHVYLNENSLESFYQGYYSPTKASVLGFLTMVKKEEVSKTEMAVESVEESGQGSSGTSGTGGQSDGANGLNGSAESEQSGGQKSESQNSNGEEIIVNTGDCVVCREGKMVCMLTLEQLNGINLLNNKSKKQVIHIKDVEINGQNVDAVYQILQKKVIKNIRFENSVPVYETHLIIEIELVEVKGGDSKLQFNTEFSHITEQITNKLDKEMKKQYASAINTLKEHKADVINVYEDFERKARAQTKKFLSAGVSAEDFIGEVVFKLNITIQND